MNFHAFTAKVSSIFMLTCIFCASAAAQIFIGERESFPPDLDQIYGRGLAYLCQIQKENGNFEGHYGDQPGVIGLCIVAMLASGEDPNTGKYSANVKKGLNSIFEKTNKNNGYIGNSMYNHSFATLALAEVYGAVDDSRIGPALNTAVKLILSAQEKNPKGAWRYSPESKDADTTVSGAAAVALFAASNAGIAVPEASISKALSFFEACRGDDGGFGYDKKESSNYQRGAIGALLFLLASRRDSPIRAGASEYLRKNPPKNDKDKYYYYGQYYAAQAFFQEGAEAWNSWNEANVSRMRRSQEENGSWNGQLGPAFSTAAALLSMALNYRYLPIYERR